MADVTVERALYQLVGEGSSYEKMLKDASKQTEDFSKKTKDLEGFLGDLDKFGKTAGWWNSDKVKEYKDQVTGLTKDLKGLTEVFKDKPEKGEGVLGSLDTLGDVATGVQGAYEKLKGILSSTGGIASTTFGVITTAVNSTKTALVGATTAAGAFSLAVKVIPVVAIAAAVAYVGKALYDHVQNLDKLNKKLEENKEINDAWVASYRSATDVMVLQSQIIPDAAGKVKFITNEYEQADRAWSKLNKEVQGLSIRKEGLIKPATGLAIDVLAKPVENLLGVVKETGDVYDSFGEKIESTTKKTGVLGRSFVYLKDTFKSVSSVFTGIVAQPFTDDAAEMLKATKDMEEAMERRKAATLRMAKLADEMKDSAGKIQTTIRQALGREQFGVMTTGMTPYQKETFAFEQQIKFLKESSSLLEESGDWDVSDEVWATYKSVTVLFEAFKTASSEGAIKQSVEDIKVFKKQLQESITTIGMTSNQLRRFKIERNIMESGGVPSKTQLDKLDAMIAKQEEAFANRKLAEEAKALNARLMEEGRQLNARYRSEEEKTADAVEHLNDLFDRGAIEAKTYEKAIEELTNKNNRLRDSILGITAVSFGSAEHISRLMAQMESFGTRSTVAAREHVAGGDWGGEGGETWISPAERKIARRTEEIQAAWEAKWGGAFEMGVDYPPIIRIEQEVEKLKEEIRKNAGKGKKPPEDDDEEDDTGSPFDDPEWINPDPIMEHRWEDPIIAAPGGGGKTASAEAIVNALTRGFNAVIKAIKDNPSVEIEEADFDEFDD